MKGYTYKRGNSYTYVIDIGRNPITNKRQQKAKGGFKTKKEAEMALAEILNQVNQGVYVEESNITLKEFSEIWIDIYAKTHDVKVSSVRVRKKEIKNILSYFKEVKLRDVTGIMYQAFLLDMFNRYAENTLVGIHRTARMIFKKAVEMKILKTDPTQYAKLPKKKKTVKELETESMVPNYYEKEELEEFLKYAYEDPDTQVYAIFILFAYTGMRIGELCALKWKDLNLVLGEGSVKIYKTYYNPNNNTKEYDLLTPKTVSSKRDIVISDFVIKVLKQHKAYQNELRLRLPNWHKEDFVFTNITNYPGYPMLPKNIENKMSSIIKNHNMKKITPHGLRHTHASLLAQAGVGLDEIMERLGHVDDSITRQVYLHVTRDMKKEAKIKFDNLMNTI